MLCKAQVSSTLTKAPYIITEELKPNSLFLIGQRKYLCKISLGLIRPQKLTAQRRASDAVALLGKAFTLPTLILTPQLYSSSLDFLPPSISDLEIHNTRHFRHLSERSSCPSQPVENKPLHITQNDDWTGGPWRC